MRIFLTLLLCCCLASGGGMAWNKQFARAEAGYLVHDTFDRLTMGANWDTQSGANVSMYNSNVLVVGAVDVQDYWIYTNWYTAAEEVIVEWRQFAIATNANTSGVFFNWRAQSASTNRSIWLGLYGASDTDAGKVKIGHENVLTEDREAPSGLRVTGFGQAWIDMKVCRTNNTFHVYATNPANGSYSHTNMTFDYRESGAITPVSSYFGFAVVGGSNLIDDLRITLNVKVPIHWLDIGKSIDDGSSATNLAARYFSQMKANANWPSAMNAAGFDYTTNWQRREMVQGQPFGEFTMYRPKYTCINFGSDLIGGIASNTWTGTLRLLVETLRTNGHTVNVAAALPNNTADHRPWNLVASNSVAAAGFVNNVIYVGWTEMRTNDSSAHPPFYHADLLHPNAAGHTNIATAKTPRYLRP